MSRFCLHCWITLGVCLLVAGCGSAGDPCSVSGEVSFDGQPVVEGDLRFFPVDGTPGRGAGAKIQQGKYEIPADSGLMAGSYRVSITAFRATGRQIPNPEQMPGEPATVDEVLPYIPETYNTRTTLKVRLTAGENRQDFPLEASK